MLHRAAGCSPHALRLQRAQVLTALEQDASVLARSGLTPTCLPALVDHNPVIAVEVGRSRAS